VLDEREQGVAVLVPVNLVTRIVGVRRILKVIMGLQALAHVSLSAARGRFLASDSLLISQKSALEREGEVNGLVHMVNNVAQDIAMQCENIHQLLAECKSLQVVAEKLPLVVKEVKELEVASRNLSAGVSDTKLLNELLRIGSFSRTDIVSILPIVEDLRAFADYRSKRRGMRCAIEAEVGQAVAVKVTSREFLETCLRALFKESLGEVLTPAEVKVFCRANDDVVVFEFLGFGEGALQFKEERERFRDGQGEREHESSALSAVRRFAELCAGAFEVRPADAPYRSRLVMSLPRGILAAPKRAARGKWALFVDDNPQVTTFYGRIAEALTIPFFTAASVTEALSIVEREGQPRFVISDLQLGEETGLDVVRTLRERFGKDLPIIVVSGNVAEDVRVQVQQAGASNFLAKPVGRARLVAEMQALSGATAG
jgi:CheY-like chemotaxis protein